MTHMDFAHVDIGVVTVLSQTEMGEIETALDTFLTAMTLKIPSTWTLDRYRWHEYRPIDSRPGPAVRDTDKNSVFTGAARLPDQLAITTTYHTCSRKHWGRSYWPMNAYANVDVSYGRITNATAASISAALEDVLETDGAGNGIFPVVASIQYQGVMNIRELVVDNVFDVIRRRRAKAASYRSTETP